MYKVLVLIIEEFGGSKVFLTRFSGSTFRINTGPCCCCCMCLPRVPMSQYVYQLKYSSNSSLCSLPLKNWWFLSSFNIALIYIIFYTALVLHWQHIVLWMHTFLMGFFPSFRRLLFWLKVGALQYAILKTALSILSVVLWTNGNFDLSDVSIWYASCLIVLKIKWTWHKISSIFFASLSARDHRYSHLD